MSSSDYQITLLRPVTEAVGKFEQDMLALLFADQPAIEQLRGLSWWGRITHKADLAAAADYEVGKTVALSDIKQNAAKLQKNQQLLARLRQDAQQDLETDGYIETLRQKSYLDARLLTRWWVWPLILAGFFLLPVLSFVGIVLLVIMLFMTRRTAQGYAARNHLLGFKDFLSVTDKERFAFHNAPEKSPEQFMEYLPFAIALGVDKEWAATFKDITIAAPDWYDGGFAGAAFDAAALTQGLNGFSSSLASAAASSSGSSGGGSVGGGVGGGGGGSW